MKVWFGAVALVLAGCGVEEANRTSARSGADAVVAPGTDTGTKADSDPGMTSGTGTDRKENTADNDEVVGSGSGVEVGSGSVATPPPAMTGKEYFNTVVYKLFDAQCSSCHADPRTNPSIKGPLTIFSYPTMKKLLDGTSATESALVKKMRAVTPHSGGNRCQDKGPTGTPCKEVLAWWRLENGADAGLAGDLVEVTAAGEVRGFAVNVNDVAAVLSVELRVDGKAVLTLTADGTGEDGGFDGMHGFKGMLPAALRDGKERDLSAFVEIGGKEVQVGATKHFAAYTPRTAGRTYFANTVAPALQGKCASCHSVQYEVQYAALLEKPKFLGGTATDNEMINRPSGAVAHPGGNICGSKSGSPCNLLQQWWTIEFQ